MINYELYASYYTLLILLIKLKWQWIGL